MTPPDVRARRAASDPPAALFCLTVAAWLLLAANAPHAQAPAPGPAGALPALDAGLRTAVVDSLCAALDSIYVFPDKAAAMGRLLRERLAAHAYDSLTDPGEFAGRLTEDLRSIAHDGHLQVLAAAPPAPGGTPAAPDGDQAQRQRDAAVRRNFGFEKVERLTGNVGYLDLREFQDVGAAGGTAVAAMNFLANSDALIIDLRQNTGGAVTMIQLLCSYLLSQPTHLNDFYVRQDGSTVQYWSQAHVEGRRLDSIPVFVLTSGVTFSAAEEFSYDLKNLKRATLVGETTGGGAHPVAGFAFLGLPIAARIPFGRAINPITHANWEGTGVEPDVKVPAGQALLTAHLAALDSIAARTSDPDRKRALAWAATRVKTQSVPVVLDAKALRSYVGAYGPRTITLENGVLVYQRLGSPQSRLIPAGGDLFLLELTDGAQARFERDERGRIARLVMLFDDGRVLPSARTDDARR